MWIGYEKLIKNIIKLQFIDFHKKYFDAWVWKKYHFNQFWTYFNYSNLNYLTENNYKAKECFFTLIL